MPQTFNLFMLKSTLVKSNDDCKIHNDKEMEENIEESKKNTVTVMEVMVNLE